MQFISTDNLNSGDILGKTLYGNGGTVLLSAGTILHDAYIDSLVQHGFSGVYIDSDFSQEVTICDVIDDGLRKEATDKIKDIFVKFDSGLAIISAQDLGNVRDMVDTVVDQILESRGSILNLVDLKSYDDYTFQHCVNVAVLSVSIGVAMGLPRIKLFNLGLAAIFHDIGKVKISLNILNKPGKLTDEEFTEIKKHSSYGYKITRNKFGLPTEVFVSILEHHEKYNGQGYPNGLAGEKILLPARIIAVADVYDAITSQRPYNKPMTPSDGYNFIMSNAYSHFDPNVVNAFVTKVAAYPLGTTVTLNNGAKGIVVENDKDYMLLPKIKLIPDGSDFCKGRAYVDLKNDLDAKNFIIIGVIK